MKEQISQTPKGRVTRTPVGSRNRLSIRGKDPAYEYRIVNDVDEGDRVQTFLDNGWEIETASNIKVGENRVESAKGDGSKAQLRVGQGTKAFVMKIKKEWYQEDQKSKADLIAQQEAATKQQALNGNYGNIKLSEGT